MFGFPKWSVVKNPPAKAGDAGDVGLIPESRNPLEEEMDTHSGILSWDIPWTEEPGRLHGITESDMPEHSTAMHVLLLTIVSQLVIIG